MKREAIEALTEADGVYASGPMSPSDNKYYKLKDGEERLDAMLVTPLSTSPVKSTFRFNSDGELVAITLKLDESSYEKVRQQIVEKYGQGEVADTRKEEQCIYKNGANFKLTSGFLLTRWSQKQTPTEQVLTTLMDSIIDICPSNLNYGSIGAQKSKTLFIEKAEVANQEKKNLF